MRRYGLFVEEQLVASYDYSADGYEEALTDARLMFNHDGTRHNLIEYDETHIKKEIVTDGEGTEHEIDIKG